MSDSHAPDSSTATSLPSRAHASFQRSNIGPSAAEASSNSLNASTAQDTDANSLARLVTHFVAAKRSLASTTAVYRANEIVSQARQHVEHRAVLEAKNAYIKQGLSLQLVTLHSVRTGLTTVGKEAQDDFEAVVRNLDIANDRLQGTLTSLRKTLVKGPTAAQDSVSVASTSPGSAGTEHGKTLYDFIDETTHQGLLDHLRQLIDSYNEAQTTLNASGVSVQQVSESLHQTLRNVPNARSPIEKRPKKPDSDRDGQKSASTGFHFLVSHATEMASLLQSLVSHYDLCITALKHTEGGGEAARLATSAPTSPLAEDNTSPVEESLYRNDTYIREPMPEDERRDMLSVLDNDAQQVDDVVDELNDRLEEMESELVALLNALEPARAAHVQLAAIISRMKQLNTETLPQCPVAATTFQKTWLSIRETLVTKTKDLASLAGFYENFVRSHSALLREIDRRDLVRTKIRSIADRARRDIEALYAEDQDMRSQFLKDVGEYLPRDIWPDIMAGPERWVIKSLAGDAGDEEGLVGPDAVAGRVVDRSDDDDDDDDDGDDKKHGVDLDGSAERASTTS